MTAPALRFLDEAPTRLRAAPPLFDAVEALGDHRADPSLARPRADLVKPAAVLVPIVARAEPTVLLTLRTETLSTHKGQIAFPGGRIDPGETPLDTALREAEEEIGLDRRRVTVLGYLDLYETAVTGYRITPVVARLAPPFELNPNAAEVADVFEVPLAFLMDAANHQEHEREWQGRLRRYTAMPWKERYIWGVTAGILKNLHARMSAP
jgi:8-oxo-dGTP pyrophosphatase MutT (NUDIX family)